MKATGLFIAIVLTLGSASWLSAQSLSLFDIDASNFPAMKAKFYATDASGKRLTPTAGELSLSENGVPRSITGASCPPLSPLKVVSVAMSIDVSGSMGSSDFSDLPVELGKQTAVALCNRVAMPPSQFALQTCDDKSYILQDFTTDKNKILKKLPSVFAGGGNDFVEQLLNEYSGLLNIAKMGKYKRVAVLYTDAWWHTLTSLELQRCIDTCAKYDIEFYAVIYSRDEAEPDGIKKSLGQLAQRSGGRMYDGVTSKAAADDIAMRIQKTAQEEQTCEIIWTTGRLCDPGRVNVKLTWDTLSSYEAYTLQGMPRPTLEVTPSFIAFHNKVPSTNTDTTLVITAKNSDFAVSDIRLKSGSTSFSIVNASFPMTVPKNTTKSITLRFIPADSSAVFAAFEIITDLCPSLFSVSGTYPGTHLKNHTLKLTHPNGGESFDVGVDTLITWTGLEPADTVSLEYSRDGGAAWSEITSHASGLRHVWKKVPPPASTNCLIRVRQSNTRGAASRDSFMIFPHPNPVYTCAFSRDGSMLVTSGGDSVAKVWDAIDGKLIHDLRGHSENVRCLALSPDGNLVATGAGDFTAKIWDLKTGLLLHDCIGSRNQISCIAFSPDSRLIATGSEDSTANTRLWDASSGALLYNFKDSISLVIKLAFSGDGTRLATACYDSTAKIWDTQTGTRLFVLKGHKEGLSTIAYSPDGRFVVTGCFDKTAKIWDAHSGALLFDLPPFRNWVTDITFSPDGNSFAVSDFNSGVTIWDVNSGSRVHDLKGHFNVVHCVRYSPDGQLLVSSSSDGTAKVWNVQSGTLLRDLTGHANSISQAAFSPDGRRVATASSDATARIWDLDSSSVIQEDVSDATFSVIDAAIVSRDVDLGKCLVGVSRDSSIHAFIQNSGSQSRKVDSIVVTGADSFHFQLVSGTPPFNVPAKDSHAVEFRFHPTSLGVKTASILVFTQSDTLHQTITGEGIEPVLKVVNDLVDFGAVEVGKQRDSIQVVTIKNIGTSALNISSTHHAGPNSIDYSTLSGGGPFTLAPNEERKMDLRFAPSSVGRTSGRLLFDYNGIGSPATVQLFGAGLGGLIAISNDSAFVGEKRVMKIMLLNNVKPTTQSGSKIPFHAHISSPSAIYTVDDATNFKYDQGGISYDIKRDWDGLEQTLAEFTVRAGLGSADSTGIFIEDFAWLNADGSELSRDVDLRDGSLKILGICYEGGARLLNPNGAVALMLVRPNPVASDAIDVELETTEKGRTQLQLSDVNGRVIKEFFNEEISTGRKMMRLELSDVPAGAYFLKLQTSTEVRVQRLEVVR